MAPLTAGQEAAKGDKAVSNVTLRASIVNWDFSVAKALHGSGTGSCAVQLTLDTLVKAASSLLLWRLYRARFAKTLTPIFSNSCERFQFISLYFIKW